MSNSATLTVIGEGEAVILLLVDTMPDVPAG